MSSFYQSQLRKYILKEIYKRPTFEIDILGKTYMGVMKKQRRLGKEFRWYMIHGISLGDLSHFSSETKILIDQLKRDHKQSWGDIMLQLGIVDELDRRPTSEVKKQTGKEEVLHKRDYQNSDLYQRYGLKPSRREHMPNATIELSTSLAPTKKMLSDSGKRYLNKGEKAGLVFKELTTKPKREAYREAWYKMSYDKGFHIIPKETFIELMTYLKKEKKGTLFAALKDKEITSGAVYLFYGKQLIYLYGTTDRSFGSIGAQYWLTFEIMKWAHTNKWSSIDLLGVAPVGMESGHDLEGVTRFKQVFGGDTISYVGNYDIIFNKALYMTFKKMKGK